MTDDVTDQGETQSVEDRIASRFGFPGNEQAEEPELSADESKFAELEWEGAKYKVPSSMKDAFMKNDDYTRKTQELSEQRKSMDQLREVQTQRQIESAFVESISAEQNQIAVIDAYLSQANKADWSTMTTDQMLRHKVEIDNIKEQRAALAQTINGKRQQFQSEMQNRIKELRGKSRELASKKIQGFSEATEADMRKFAGQNGFADQEIDNVLLDPRSYEVIYKAMMYDKVQSGVKPANDKLTKVLKPGAASDRMPQETVNKLNFGKAMKGAKTSAQKASLIEERLMSRFSKG